MRSGNCRAVCRAALTLAVTAAFLLTPSSVPRGQVASRPPTVTLKAEAGGAARPYTRRASAEAISWADSEL